VPLIVIFSTFLLAVGICFVLIRRNIITALIGIELILNGANLNFIFGGRIHQDGLNAQSLALIIIVIAAAQAAIALAITLHVYKKYRTIELNEINLIKDND